jgi:hypothetical protein
MDPAMSRREERTDLIRSRAYALYLERGGNPGKELEDWLAAEREVNRDLKRPSQMPSRSEPVPAAQRGTAQGFASKSRG